MSNAEPDDGGRIVALILPSFSSGKVSPATARQSSVMDVSTEWQKMGANAHLAEIHGMLNGLEEGRLTEIIGRIAAAGEQLGLASTSSRDANGWLESDRSPASVAVAARALAEITGYYSIGAAHGLGNITLRLLKLDPRSAAVVDAAYPGAKGFLPFSEHRDAWLPFNSRLAATSRDAADEIGDVNVDALVDAVVSLADDERWIALSGQRGEDFHRWRLQTISGGVPKESPWTHLDGGGRQMTVRIGNGYIPPDHANLVREADDALDALADSMRTWLDLLPAAMRGLGAPVFVVPTDPAEGNDDHGDPPQSPEDETRANRST